MEKAEFADRARMAAGKMYHVTCAYLRNESDREDAIQDALLRAWQKKSGLRDERYFETWLIRILIHVCTDMAKRQRRMIPTDTLPDQPEAPKDIENIALREMIDALEPNLRILVVLCYVEGYELKEAAAMLRLPVGTVKSRLSRARNQLRTILEKEAATQ